MSLKSAVVSFVSGKAAKFHKDAHNAKAKQYCHGCNLCEFEGRTRNPFYEIVLPNQKNGLTEMLVAVNPDLHPRQFESPMFNSVK